MKFMQHGLSRKDKARLNQASEIAFTSDCKYKHGVVVTKGGRVVAVGVNSYRSLMDMSDFVPEDWRSEHAEMAGLRALGGDADGCTFFVSRVNNLKEERMSKPCRKCQAAMKSAGVKRVVYTIDSEMNFE